MLLGTSMTFEASSGSHGKSWLPGIAGDPAYPHLGGYIPNISPLWVCIVGLPGIAANQNPVHEGIACALCLRRQYKSWQTRDSHTPPCTCVPHSASELTLQNTSLKTQLLRISS